jgi:hypothetical protein
MALTKNGIVYSWGGNNLGATGLGSFSGSATRPRRNFKENYEISEIMCGAGHTLLLLEDNTFFVWGHNERGQIGIDTTDTGLKLLYPSLKQNFFHWKEKLVGVGAGKSSSWAVSESRNLYLWGRGAKEGIPLGKEFPEKGPALFPGRKFVIPVIPISWEPIFRWIFLGNAQKSSWDILWSKILPGTRNEETK